MKLGRQLIAVALGAVVLGGVASGCLTWAWAGENLSGDFANQETGAIDLGYTAAVFLTWTAVLGAPLAILGAAAVLLDRIVRDKGP